MTDTYNLAHKSNRLIAASVNGVVQFMFCHNHLRDIWVNNMLDSLTYFLRAYIIDSLDEVAPELHVPPGFMSLASAFDKMFSLFAKYPKGLGDIFCQ